MAHDQTGRTGAPWYLWAVALLAFLWNGLGTILWGGTALSPETFLEGLPAAHRDYVAGLPAWSSIAWGLGVVGGLAGSVLLLLRHRRAVTMFAASLFGAVANMAVYVTNPPPDGFFNLPLSAFIVGCAAFLVWFARLMRTRGVI